MVKKTNLLIIIVTFNSEKYISSCIDKLLISARNVKNHKIIVIDNFSSDKTVEIVKLKVLHVGKKSISLIENRTNLGFATAVNQGIESEQSKSYLLVNPDLMVNEDTVSKILKCQSINKAGIVGVKTYDVNNRDSGSYFRFPNLFVGIFDFSNIKKIDVFHFWHKYFYYLDSKVTIGDRQVDVVTGGFMLIDSFVIKSVGLFDTSFFMYLEDVDYCYRTNLKKYKTYLCDEKVFHVGGASSKNKDHVNYSAWQDSRKKYFLKHFGFLTNMIIQPIFFIDNYLINILRIIKQ